MASRTFHFPGFSIVSGDIKADVSLNRFEKQFQEAQFWLDGQVMNDMVPYMPHRDGIFVNLTRMRSAALQGTGKVVAGALTYGNPKATPHWFDTAKEAHGKAWVRGVKRIAGGGKQ